VGLEAASRQVRLRREELAEQAAKRKAKR
jgi:hypothetical protein